MAEKQENNNEVGTNDATTAEINQESVIKATLESPIKNDEPDVDSKKK